MKSIIIVTLFLASSPSYAQMSTDEGGSNVRTYTTIKSKKTACYLGIQGGPTRNILMSNVTNRLYQYYKPGYNFSIGIPFQFQYKLTNRSEIGIGTCPSFVGKSYELARADNNTYLNQFNRNDYLQIPITASYLSNFRGFRFFVNGGEYIGYWTNGHIHGGFEQFFGTTSVATYNQRYQYNSTKDNRIEIGWHIGAGESYEFKGGYTPFLQLEFYRSTTDQQKEYMIDQVPRINETLLLSAGILKKL